MSPSLVLYATMPRNVDRSTGVIGAVVWTEGSIGLPRAVEGRGWAVVGVRPLGVDGPVHAPTTTTTATATKRRRFPCDAVAGPPR
jgi:hypothetical protein